MHTPLDNAVREQQTLLRSTSGRSPAKPAADRGGEEPTTILIVEQHTLIRDGLREILESQRDMAVVDEADNNVHAVDKAAAKRPHIVLLDAEVPGDTVTWTVGRIGEVSPSSRVIILSEQANPELLQQLLILGIWGYLLKDSSRQDLLAAVRRGREGSPDTVMLVVSRESVAQGHNRPAELLSDREREVLQLTAYALSNAQIARRLYICEATVKRHLRNIFVKLEAVSRIDAVNKAIAASLIVAPTGG